MLSNTSPSNGAIPASTEDDLTVIIRQVSEVLKAKGLNLDYEAGIALAALWDTAYAFGYARGNSKRKKPTQEAVGDVADVDDWIYNSFKKANLVS